MDEATKKALTAVAASSRALAEALDEILRKEALTDGLKPQDREAANVQSEDSRAVWDPEVDEPLVAPKVVGTRQEQDWCCLTYLGGIYAINKRYNRGANKHEVREYAIKAGYRDGRAVTAWSKGNGATQNDPDKQRWVNNAGVNYWVKGLASKFGLTLPPDLSEPWDAPNFSSAGSVASPESGNKSGPVAEHDLDFGVLRCRI
jgi:hypothetical protein